MNAKTLEAVRKHGEQLLVIFPNATERDPVALCRKLRRIETVAHKLAEDCCNWLSMESHEYEARHTKILNRLVDVLGSVSSPEVFINLDPRGYALKIDDEIMRAGKFKLHTDWGGYGIIAPDLTTN
jgi:hypothetical protein